MEFTHIGKPTRKKLRNKTKTHFTIVRKDEEDRKKMVMMKK